MLYRQFHQDKGDRERCQMTKVRIRNATAGDLGTLLALNAFVQQQHAEALPQLFKAPAASQQAVDAFNTLLKDSDSLVLLAEGTAPVGSLYAQFQNRPASWARLELQLLSIQHMVVAPKFRRRGVGTLLMSAALDAARSRGITRVEVDVWSFNSDASHFYAKHGFKVFNERMQLSIDKT
jgi:ribosomal protein S18 acetylase RimI-like enzyme